MVRLGESDGWVRVAMATARTWTATNDYESGDGILLRMFPVCLQRRWWGSRCKALINGLLILLVGISRAHLLKLVVVEETFEIVFV